VHDKKYEERREELVICSS